MQIGVIYPQTEYGDDPVAIKDFAQTAEGLGYRYIMAYDHVLGANPERPGGWQGVYTFQSAFLEPLVLFSSMASITQKLGFATGIIILPQRQTALFAKQAATLDVLCMGRLRLGVGLGWNAVEYQALNEDFHTRGRRSEEQVSLLRQLWTQPLVNFSGRWHTIPDAGINPLPVQRPIPIWFGGHSEPALRRAARLGDGWMTSHRTAINAQPALEQLERFLDEYGRDRSSFGVDGRIMYGSGEAGIWEAVIHDWEEAGATHLSLNTMGHNFLTPAAHLAALRRFAEAIGLR